jgi:hypothetical protein
MGPGRIEQTVSEHGVLRERGTELASKDTVSVILGAPKVHDGKRKRPHKIRPFRNFLAL